MLKLVHGNNVVTLKTAYKWYERFKSGNESVEDELRTLLDPKNRQKHAKSDKTGKFKQTIDYLRAYQRNDHLV